VTPAPVTASDLIAALRAERFPLAREKETQVEIAAAFDRRSIAYRREVDIGNRDIIDFLVNAIGIEVKIGGAKRAIHAQCVRYCETGKLSALILATNVAIGFPSEIAGRPCFVVSLGRAWL
jgi:hypothetical protein